MLDLSTILPSISFYAKANSVDLKTFTDTFHEVEFFRSPYLVVTKESLRGQYEKLHTLLLDYVHDTTFRVRYPDGTFDTCSLKNFDSFESLDNFMHNVINRNYVGLYFKYSLSRDPSELKYQIKMDTDSDIRAHDNLGNFDDAVIEMLTNEFQEMIEYCSGSLSDVVLYCNGEQYPFDYNYSRNSIVDVFKTWLEELCFSKRTATITDYEIYLVDDRNDLMEGVFSECFNPALHSANKIMKDTDILNLINQQEESDNFDNTFKDILVKDPTSRYLTIINYCRYDGSHDQVSYLSPIIPDESMSTLQHILLPGLTRIQKQLSE